MNLRQFHSSPVLSRILLYGILTASMIFVLKTDFGGYSGISGHAAVITRYYGVPPEEIEKAITIPMEEAAASIPGIEEMTASSETSISRIDLRLRPSTDTDAFIISLREKIDRTYSIISKTTPAIQKPQIVRSDSTGEPVFCASFSREGLSPAEVRPLIENDIKPSFERISGLGEIIVAGGAMPEIHIEIDAEKSAALGLDSNDIASLVNKANDYIPIGIIDNFHESLPVNIEARLKTIAEIANLPINKENRLSGVSEISYSNRSPEEISRLDGFERVCIYVKSSSPELIRISRQLRTETRKWEDQGWDIVIIDDEGALLEDSFRQITAALIAGMLCSSLILLILKVNPKRILILFTVQPVILFISLGTLSAAGILIDQFLIAGLAIGIGMILDSSLLVTDAIDNSEKTFNSIIPPLISSTVSTLAAMIPVFTIADEIKGIGSIVKAMGIMLVVSLVISIFFIPSWYKSGAAGQILPGLKKIVLKTISCKNNKIIIITAIILPTAAGLSLITVPVCLSPVISSPVIHASLELREGENIKSSDKKMKQLVSNIEEKNSGLSILSTSRRSGGTLTIRFDDKNTNRASLLDSIRKASHSIPGSFLYISDAPEDGNTRLKISITGPNQQRIEETARAALNIIMKNEWAHEGVLHFKNQPPAIYFIPDKKALAGAGLSAAETASFLHWNLHGPVADKWHVDGSERDIKVMALNSNKLTLSDLKALKIPGDQGTFFRLDQLGKFIETTESSRINRLNRQHSAAFSVESNLKDPVKLTKLIRDQIQNIELPAGYTFIISKELVEKQQIYNRLWSSLGLSVLLIFFLLSIERESLSQAVLILLPLPLIMSFPLLFISIAGRSIDTSIILGLIILTGLGINNGILIIENIDKGVIYSIEKRFNGLSLTTITSLCGMLPMLFTNEIFFQNIASVLICGLCSSFLVSIFIYPHLLNLWCTFFR